MIHICIVLFGNGIIGKKIIIHFYNNIFDSAITLIKMIDSLTCEYI